MVKKLTLVTCVLMALVVAAWSSFSPSVKDSLTYGNPNIETLGVLAFGPENLLLAGDSKNASVFAIDIKDDHTAADNSPVTVNGLDKKIAALLGTTPDGIRINDMAVHPTSQQIYLSVTRGQGEAAGSVLLRVNKEGDVEEVPLENVRFSSTAITNAPAEDATDNRGRNLRVNTITDLNYADGHVYVAGLSNEEFASSFRKLAFPFEKEMESATLEIFHVAHGQYETHAPIRTFMPYEIEGKAHILAAYTCTPLVTFPLDNLKDGSHVKGKTVAELGWGNAPLDMISFEKDDTRYVLIANSNRTAMLINADKLDQAKSLTEPLGEGMMTEGVDYASLPLTGVLELSMLNDEHFVLLQRVSEDGSIRLRSYPISRI